MVVGGFWKLLSFQHAWIAFVVKTLTKRDVCGIVRQKHYVSS